MTDEQLNKKLRRDDAILWLKALLGATVEAGALAYLVRSVWPPHSVAGFYVIFAAVWVLFALENLNRLYRLESERLDAKIKARLRRARRAADP